jgi:hypothetical protein
VSDVGAFARRDIKVIFRRYAAQPRQRTANGIASAKLPG